MEIGSYAGIPSTRQPGNLCFSRDSRENAVPLLVAVVTSRCTHARLDKRANTYTYTHIHIYTLIYTDMHTHAHTDEYTHIQGNKYQQGRDGGWIKVHDCDQQPARRYTLYRYREKGSETEGERQEVRGENERLQHTDTSPSSVRPGSPSSLQLNPTSLRPSGALRLRSFSSGISLNAFRNLERTLLSACRSLFLCLRYLTSPTPPSSGNNPGFLFSGPCE